MGLQVSDRIKETSTTTGTGAFTLAGARTGFRAFSAVCANLDTVHYCITRPGSGEWEVGLGTWGTGNILTRTTVLSSSNAGAAVNFSTGTKDVFLTNAANSIRLQQWLGLPEIKRADFQISEATIRTLFSSPVTLLPAVVGVMHQPVFGHYFREAGSAYTIGAATNYSLILNGVAYDSRSVLQLFNGAGPYTQMMLQDMVNGGASPYGAVGVVSSTRDDTNKALTLAISGGNLSGGTGRLFLTLFYRDWSNAALSLPAGSSYTVL